jgi:membrane protein DedA with SNARE-associated domain
MTGALPYWQAILATLPGCALSMWLGYRWGRDDARKRHRR